MTFGCRIQRTWSLLSDGLGCGRVRQQLDHSRTRLVNMTFTSRFFFGFFGSAVRFPGILTGLIGFPASCTLDGQLRSNYP